MNIFGKLDKLIAAVEEAMEKAGFISPAQQKANREKATANANSDAMSEAKIRRKEPARPLKEGSAKHPPVQKEPKQAHSIANSTNVDRHNEHGFSHATSGNHAMAGAHVALADHFDGNRKLNPAQVKTHQAAIEHFHSGGLKAVKS